MTTQPERDYYIWLISQIAIPRNNHNTYDDLFTRMHDTEFVWIVPNDDNRLQDGEDLREEFLNGARGKITSQPVSLLEVLIALSRRTASNAGGRPEVWAWKLIKNLRLNKASDPLVGQKAEHVEDILEALIWRTYERHGRGSFFPLKKFIGDATKLEIWDQMQTYVNEMEGL